MQASKQGMEDHEGLDDAMVKSVWIYVAGLDRHYTERNFIRPIQESLDRGELG